MSNYYSYPKIPDRSFGGKADGLIFLSKNCFNVPQYFIIPDKSIQKIISGSLEPESLFNEWKANVNPDKDSLWALRSSAGVEDGTVQSYAGMFITVLNCRPENLTAALEEVITGFKQIRASNYHKGDDFSFNVILQEMVQGEISGVGFSINPLEQQNENPMASIIPGLGFKLVSGEENGMGIDLSAAGPKVISQEEIYRGEIFASSYKTITLSSEELIAKAKPYLKEIREQLIQLKQIKGYEVDTEFTIYEDHVYWLQVRPITSLMPKGEYTVWDNSNLAINYPGVTLPLTSSYMFYSYSKVYIRMCRFLGSGNLFIERNYDLFKNMLGTIKGGMYYNITAWQQLLFQLPFGRKTSRLITKMMGADEAKFSKPGSQSSPLVYIRLFFNLMKSILFFDFYKKKYLTQYESTRKQFEESNLETKSHDELIDIHNHLESDLGKYWYPPMINGFFAMLSYNGLNKILAQSRLHHQYPNFLNDAIGGIGDVVSVEIVRALQDLIYRVNNQEEVKKIILEEESSEALHHIKMQHPEYYGHIMSYLNRFGERCDEGEMKMETVNYREDPSKFIILLKANLSVPYYPRAKTEKFDYVRLLKENYRYSPIRFLLLRTGLKFTTNRVRDRENFRFIRTKTFAMARQIFREMDKRLLEQGLIIAPGDSLYLQFEELMTPDLAGNFKTFISKRKAEYDAYQNEYHPLRYHQINAQFYAIEKKSSPGPNELSGTGCSSGIVTGEALQVNSQNIHGLDVKGKILIASFFEPGWIGLFARAGGLIAERGSLLSHTAILCREMSIPLIVSASKATKTISDGEKIKMNGATGSIERISNYE